MNSVAALSIRQSVAQFCQVHTNVDLSLKILMKNLKINLNFIDTYITKGKRAEHENRGALFHSISFWFLYGIIKTELFS